MKLRELLTTISELVNLPDHGALDHEALDHEALDHEVTGLCTNSLACQTGELFLGMPGTRVDGGEFWPGALKAGAIAALVTPAALAKKPVVTELGGELAGACVIPVEDMARVCAQVATAFYGYPSQQMKLVGVTGTNGKTTTTHLIEFFLNQAHYPTALLGTLYARWPGFEQVASHTTPFSVDLQKQLATAIKAGAHYGVMEVSSHALAQKRTLGCVFQAAVFTNLTQDHLDYHRDMEDYFAAKALLFQPDYLQGRAILNTDDSYGQRLMESLTPETVWSYSTQGEGADFWTRDLHYGASGVEGVLETPQGAIAFCSPLVGQFNLANLLAAVAAGLHLGLSLESMIAALPLFPGVPGRMERVVVSPNPDESPAVEQDISVIVDYAHTPDSLENLLRAARPFISGQMICVFGCGGDRDRGKRPQMGAIAAALADQVVVTSDNPRTENPDQILQDILAGIPETVQPVVLADRAEAIQTAISQAKSGDGVLIAGKGHEDYQILGTEKVHFDDREQARLALEQRLGV